MDDYHIADIYQGGYSTLDPNSGFIGYRIPSQKMGLATDPRTANLLQEVSTKLQTGAKQIELATIQPTVFDSIPNQQLKELKRLSELTGVDISVHGPLIEPSGVSQQGAYTEYARKEAERQMLSAVLRSHEINPKGNIPVTFHSTVGFQGTEYQMVKNAETGKMEERKVRIPIINQDTGQATAVVQEEQRYEPGMSRQQLKEGETRLAEQRLKDLNMTQWVDSLTQLVAIKNRADRMLQESAPVVYPLIKKAEKGEIDLKYLDPDQREFFSKFNNAGAEIEDIYAHLRNLFEKAYRFGSDKEKEELIKISEKFPDVRGMVARGDYSSVSNVMQGLMEQLRGANPQVLKPVDEFALDKSATTFANVAFDSYKKFKDTAPIISIENPPVGVFGLSRGEDLKKLAESARKKFVERAEKEGISRKLAEEQASKLIGVTWDVGHINMLRKYGFTEENIIKESEKVAPFVKHVHLSDNFGFEHTELPMGMGNVPVKQIMEKLGQKGFEARKIIEAGNWWEHFKTSPFQPTLEAFGSPIYGMKMQPYWTQAVGSQGYFSGYGQMLPQINYETFGSGFSMLPSELGGQRQQTGRSRMSGQPLE